MVIWETPVKTFREMTIFDPVIGYTGKKDNSRRRPAITDFIITEDFPKNEAEFDERFSNEQTCYDYLFTIRWPQVFICRRR